MAGRSETEQSWEEHRLLYQHFAPAVVLNDDEAKGFVLVEYCKYAVVVELRRYMAVSSHFPHSGSSDTEYTEEQRGVRSNQCFLECGIRMAF